MTKSEWDAYVLRYAPTAFFQSWAWGEAEKKQGHKVWRLSWSDGIAQVMKVEARRGTFLHVRHGPIGMIHADDLKNLAKREGAWFVRVSPQIEDTENNKKLLAAFGMKPSAIHAMDAEICWKLDITKSKDELLSDMRKTTRYEIRHTQGIKVEKTRQLERFFALYDVTSHRHGFVQHSGIQEEFATLDSRLYVASYQGSDLAAAIIVDHGNEAIYRHGASRSSKIPASYLLQWEAIREAKERGKKVYNFWGIAPENSLSHPWRGITMFKKGFGGRQINYIHAHDFPISSFYVVSRLVETWRRVAKGY